MGLAVVALAACAPTTPGVATGSTAPVATTLGAPATPAVTAAAGVPPAPAGSASAAGVAPAAAEPRGPLDPASAGSASAAGRRFATLGRNQGQFTDGEFATLAATHSLVIVSKFHGGFDINLHHQAATELKRRNPSIRVLAYMSTKYWYERAGQGWQEPGFDHGFDRSWLLRDAGGNLVPKRKDGAETDTAFVIDVANPSYRQWAVDLARHWMAVAPWDGVHFDAGNDLADGFDGRAWSRVIGPERVTRYNAGIADLMAGVKEALGPQKLVTFNGLAPAPWKGPDRSQERLGLTDGATHESFCSTRGQPNGHLIEDLTILGSHPGKHVMYHTNYPAGRPAAEAQAVGRYCHAAFLMAWQPGVSFHKFAVGAYGAEQISQRLPELDLDLGAPTGGYSREGDLLRRDFERGTVMVNVGAGAVEVPAPPGHMLFEGGEFHPVPAGSALTVPAGGSAYLLLR